MRLTHSRVASLAVLSLGLITSTLAKSLVARDSTDFNWASLASSTNLSWTPCYATFQCARFTVPLQYSNLSAGEAQIALVTSPSDFKSGDENYLGPILFNPGGPGGSGVQYVLELADYFRAIVGPQYDLVGFDPRGVGETTPPLSIFDSPAEALEFYSGLPLNTNESFSSLGRFYTQSRLLANLVLDRAQDVAESMSTAAVATDMLAISKAFGFDKLNYWGVSYGSVLGATYAAMFPNNVGRLLIDGVVNSHDWYSGSFLSSSLQDTDKALASVYEACLEAGPTLCAIYENSTDLISARVNKIIDAVHTLPVPVYNDTSLSSITFGSVDYPLLMGQLFQMVYFPYALASIEAEGLVQLEQGASGSIIYQGSTEQSIEAFATCTFNSGGQPLVTGLQETTSAIICGDSLVNQTVTFPELQSMYNQEMQISVLAPAAFSTYVGTCTTWPITGKDRFNASFITNTSSPIMLIGNTYDPITPIAGAKNMSAGFAGSVMLQQNSTGHTTLSGFSTCTALAIHAYFANGTLPAPGTVCQPDTKIFQNPTNSSAVGGGVNFTMPIARRGEPEAYTVREAIDVVTRSNFLAKSSAMGRMLRRAF